MSLLMGAFIRGFTAFEFYFRVNLNAPTACLFLSWSPDRPHQSNLPTNKEYILYFKPDKFPFAGKFYLPNISKASPSRVFMTHVSP